MISDINAKVYQRASRVVRLSNEQGLLHFKGRTQEESQAIETGKIKTDFTSIIRTRNYTNY